MSNSQYDDAEFDIGMHSDGEFNTPLERVNFEAGILLGVEATRDEQDYHRRRLNRHRYWLQGAGTVVGLAVILTHRDNGKPETAQPVYLNIGPGVGIDGLGREVLSHEPYCLDFRAWLLAQWESSETPTILGDGLDAENSQLHLQVTMRYASCPSAKQPVMARKLNAGTDPVAPSRQQDSVLFELVAGQAPSGDGWPWNGHTPLPSDERPELTNAEQAYFNSLNRAGKTKANEIGARVYGLPMHDRALDLNDTDPAVVARTLLASVIVDLNPDHTPQIHPDHIRINNLVRPLVRGPEQG